jgi:hypothetical protein
LQVAWFPFEYEEADYAFDAHLGGAANYTDSPTLPLINFIRQGLERGRSADARSGLSESIRSSNDVIFYRHWHGPLYFYGLMLGSGLLHMMSTQSESSHSRSRFSAC